jgi:glycerol uptake facilitator protein
MEKYIAEMLGTMVLVVINNGVVANVLLKQTKGNTKEHWWMISFGAGMAVTLGIFVAMNISGAHINPAVSIAFYALGTIGLTDLLGYIGFQMFGAIIGAFIVYLVYKRHFDATEENDLKLAAFSTSPAIPHRLWNMVTEIIATFFLVGMVVVLTHDSNQVPTYIIPFAIGLLVMVLGVSLGGSTGFAMNPARDLGPRITHTLLRLGNSNWKYAMIPVLGPIVGGIIGALVFSVYLGGI